MRVGQGIRVALFCSVLTACLDFSAPRPQVVSDSVDTSTETLVEVISCTVDTDCAGRLEVGPCERADCVSQQCVIAPDLSRIDQPCTTASLCVQGVCAGNGQCLDERPVVCTSDPSTPCLTSQCDETSGNCVQTPRVDGTECSQSLCLQGTCGAGLCRNLTPRDGPCSTGRTCFIDGSCNTKGACVETWDSVACACQQDSECNDALGCTTETCQDGQCTFSVLQSTCLIDGTCYFPNDPFSGDACRLCAPQKSQFGWSLKECNDEQPCTADACVDGSCVHDETSFNGMPCSNDACGGALAECSDGVCGSPCSTQCVLSTDCDSVPGLPTLSACEEFACINGTCEVQSFADGTDCNPGSPCIAAATCVGGQCELTPVACNNDNACAIYACAEVDGQPSCELADFADAGASCDDGDPCTENDVCGGAGDCQGTPLDCSPLDTLCAVATCVGGDCSQLVAVTDGTSCETPSTCQAPSSCNDGVCESQPCSCSTGADCDDGLACTLDGCNQGACEHVLQQGCVIDGACQAVGDVSPGNACHVCDPSLSKYSWSLVSCDDGEACTRNDCAPQAGCVNTPNDASLCSDGKDCSTDDRCEGGQCVGTCACTTDGDCDGLAPPCQKLVCDTTFYFCKPVPDPELALAPCETGLFCAVNGVCNNGTCVAAPRDCSGEDGLCALGACDDVIDACVAVPQTSGACDDGDSCTQGDACDSESDCVGSPVDCSALDSPCVEGACAQGNCVPFPKNGEPCDDGELCTVGDTCKADGSCGGAWDIANASCECLTDSACEALDGACVKGVCDVSTNSCTIELLAQTTPCDDGDPCTVEDVCNDVGGCSGTLSPCVDGISCTADLCDGLGGCSHEVIEGFCLIGQACIVDGSPFPDSPCLSCNHEVNATGWSQNLAAACDDGDPCTKDDNCSAGTCAGTPYSCVDDGKPCTDELCNADDDGCTSVVTVGTCHIGGQCYDDGDEKPEAPCKVCAAEVAATQWTNRTGSCTDDNPCTFNEACIAGSCIGPVTPCNDGRNCTVDTCTGPGQCANDLLAGYCLIDATCRIADVLNPLNECERCKPDEDAFGWTPVASGTLCDDGLPCTVADVCDGDGACSGSASCTPLVCEEAICESAGECSLIVKPGYCRIAGACYIAGSVKAPEEPCLVCDPTNAAEAWSESAGSCDDLSPCTQNDTCDNGQCTGTTYSCDDGLACTSDACDGAGGCINTPVEGFCAIGGVCYAEGTPKPDNECQVCHPSSDSLSWSNTEAIPCGAEQTCVQRSCVSGVCATAYDAASNECFIDGACYPAGENSDNPCQFCIPTSPYLWTFASDGTECASKDETVPDCNRKECVSGSCAQLPAYDFSSCGELASGLGSLCYSAVCHAFNETAIETHANNRVADAYLRGATWSGGGATEGFALYVIPDSASCQQDCSGALVADLFDGAGDAFDSILIEESLVLNMAEPSEPLQYGDSGQPLWHDAITNLLGVNGFLYPRNSGSFVASSLLPKAAVGYRAVAGGLYPSLGAAPVEENHIFAIDHTVVVDCGYKQGAWSCLGFDDLSIGSDARLVDFGGRMTVVDTFSNQLRVVSRNAPLQNWSTWATSTQLFDSSPLNDAAAKDQYAVLVGNSGLFVVAEVVNGAPKFSEILFPKPPIPQTNMAFTSAIVRDGIFAVAGHGSYVSQDGYERGIVVAMAPANAQAKDPSKWNVSVVALWQTNDCSSPCPLEETVVNDIIPTPSGLVLVGGKRTAIGVQERAYWNLSFLP